MECMFCGKEIPVARLEALPDTQTCIGCSTEVRKVGIAEGLSKSQTVLHVLDPNSADGRNDINLCARYTPYRFGNSVMYTGVSRYPFGKG